MRKYETQVHWCNRCNQKVPVVFGSKGLCGSCHKLYYGNTKTLTEMERKIIQQEEDIVDLQTIINLMQDMSNKLKEHNTQVSANTEAAIAKIE
jgi:hypothetical protein